MNSTPRTVVAFIFSTDGREWHGGKNYFRALFGALDADPECRVQVTAAIGRKIDAAGFDFPASVNFTRTSALDRRSLAWFVDRVLNRMLGYPPLLTLALRRAGVHVISHSVRLESNSFPTIGWLPDFQHIHLPHFFQPEEIAARNAQFESLLNQAALVIVSSNTARSDLEKFSPANAAKARVLQFCAVRPELGENQGEDLTKLYELADRFFYLPNQFWAHKNHRVAVEALAVVRRRWPNAQIVCSGALSDYRNPTHIDALRNRISELGLQDNFKLLGLIPYDHIARLIVKSLAVINPSHFEGWSTTVEEAKALGAPLLLSDLAVHREQCQSNEALFFPPDDSDALAGCMESLLSGTWPSADNNRITSALHRHQVRSMTFSRTYQSIVEELANLSSR